MTVNDLVKVTHYLLHERDVPDYVKVGRASWATRGRHRCCSPAPAW